MAGLLKHTYQAIRRLEKDMYRLRLAGLGPSAEAYNKLFRARAGIWRSVGLKRPKVMQLIFRLVGLSPGSVEVWHDAEAGWFSKARVSPEAPPAVKAISTETAITILKGQLTHELEQDLMTPDEYYGE